MQQFYRNVESNALKNIIYATILRPKNPTNTHVIFLVWSGFMSKQSPIHNRPDVDGWREVWYDCITCAANKIFIWNHRPFPMNIRCEMWNITHMWYFWIMFGRFFWIFLPRGLILACKILGLFYWKKHSYHMCLSYIYTGGRKNTNIKRKSPQNGGKFLVEKFWKLQQKAKSKLMHNLNVWATIRKVLSL